MKKILLLLIISSLAFSLSACGKKAANLNNGITDLVEDVTGITDIKIEQKAEKNLAIAEARNIFNIRKLEGVDMSNGPCLSNRLIEDWVFDIAHNPRQDVDNLPENQCSAFSDGTARHFVEFDPDGNLIRAE